MSNTWNAGCFCSCQNFINKCRQIIIAQFIPRKIPKFARKIWFIGFVRTWISTAPCIIQINIISLVSKKECCKLTKKTLFYFNIFCLNEFIIFLYQAIDFQDSNKMCRKCPSFREPSKLASVDRLEIYPNNNGISLVYIHLPLSP